MADGLVVFLLLLFYSLQPPFYYILYIHSVQLVFRHF